MEVVPVSPEQILTFVAITIVPGVVDVLRITLFQLGMRLGWGWLANLTASSKFGIAMTMLVSLLAGLGLAIWLNGVEPTPAEIVRNSFAILGWATAIYKLGGYEKSDMRKALATTMDKLGPEFENADTDGDLPETSIELVTDSNEHVIIDPQAVG